MATRQGPGEISPLVPRRSGVAALEPSFNVSIPMVETSFALDALKDHIAERRFMKQQFRVVTHLDSDSENDIDDERPNETEPRWRFEGNGEATIAEPTLGDEGPRLSQTFDGASLLPRRSTLRNLKQPAPPPATVGDIAENPPTHFKFRLGIKVLNDSRWRHLKVMYGRQRFYVHTPSLVVAIVTLLLIWGFLYFALDGDGRDAVTPGGWIFDPFVLVFLSGVVGGIASVLLHLPPLLCILWVSIGVTALLGLEIRNYRSVTHPIKTVGLAMILLRGGISVNLKAIRPIKVTVLLMSIVPLFAEILVLTFVNAAVWHQELDNKFDLKEGFLFGSTVSPLSSSIIVTSALHLQSAGHGLMGGPPPVMIASVPFDSALGIWLANFALELCLPTPESVLDDTGSSASGSFGLTSPAPKSLFLQPITPAPTHKNKTGSHDEIFLSKPPLSLLQIPFGIIGGVIGGVVAEMLINVLYGDRGTGTQSAKTHDDPRNDDDRDLRTNIHNRVFALVFMGCIMFMALTNYYGVEGMGSLFVAAFGTTLGTRWRARKDGDDRRKQFASRSAVVWNLCLMPALFAFVGASADFGQAEVKDKIGYMLLVIVAGCVTRMLAAFMCSMTSRDFTTKERILMALGWVGKASAQATLGMAVRDRVDQYCTNGNPCVGWQTRGAVLSTMSVLMIMVAAPISAISIRTLGRTFVRKDDLGEVLAATTTLPAGPPPEAPPQV